MANASIARHIHLSVRSVVTVTLLIAFTATGWAFDSYGTHPVHDQITKAAAAALKWSEKAIKALQAAVRGVDWDETTRLKPNANYKPEHHFDRGPGVTDQNAFMAGVKYLQDQLKEAITNAMNAMKKAAIKAAGRALHALQDFKSHSNFIDLSAEDQKKAKDALFDNTKAAPGTLKLTGYDRNAKDPGKPPGDPYPHDTKSKDNPEKNEEAKTAVGDKTKFELAKQSAIDESIDLLNRIKDGVTEAQWNAVIAAIIVPDPFAAQYAWAASAPCGTEACVISSHGTTLQLFGGTLAEEEIVSVFGVPPNAFLGDDMVRIDDRARTFLWREFNAESEFIKPGIATIAFSDTDVHGFLSSTLAIYYANAAAGGWTRVTGASLDLFTGVATFDVDQAGIYAIGGVAVAEPSSMWLMGVGLFGLIVISGTAGGRASRRGPFKNAGESTGLGRTETVTGMI